METGLLGCPNCGSTFFTHINLGQKTVFQVNALYVPLIIEREMYQDAGIIDLTALHCGACTWGGGIRELVPSHDETACR